MLVPERGEPTTKTGLFIVVAIPFRWSINLHRVIEFVTRPHDCCNTVDAQFFLTAQEPLASKDTVAFSRIDSDYLARSRDHNSDLSKPIRMYTVADESDQDWSGRRVLIGR